MVVQAKLGDSVRLDCNASGDQPLQIDWFRESPVGGGGGGGSSTATNSSSNFLDKHGNDLYDIHEQPTDFGLSSHMQIRQLRGDDSLLLYKCLARNEFGSSERLIKLIAIGVPRPPLELRVRDVWSRSALISWQPPSSQQQQSTTAAASKELQSGGGLISSTTTSGRISNYTVQYWRKNPAAGPSAPVASQQQQQQQVKQNHRRDDLVVDGLHNSALLVNLLPAITYEVSVIAHNQVGRSEPSELVNVTTSEEEPSAPPTDVQVEPRGSSTLRVMWKVPPSETLNGKLQGFYVGYRPRFFAAASAAAAGSPSSSVSSATSPLLQQHQQQQQQQVQALSANQQQSHQQQLLQSVIYSFKTADAFEGQIFYETFLQNLKHNQEYELTVRAFNKAGSGPDCHVITARTNSAKLAQAPNLQVQKVTTNSVTLKWTATVFVGRPSASMQQQQHHQLAGQSHSHSEILRYVLYYQIQGERDWYELTVGRSAAGNTNQPPADSVTASDLQQQPAPVDSMLQQIVGDELISGELIGSHSSVHTLSNLQPGYVYRVYVAAANDYGIGDPSNVVTLRTDLSASQPQGGAARSAYLGGAVLDDASGALAASGGGFFESWGRQQQQWGPILYTTLTFAGLIGLLVILGAYLVWQHKIRNKYNHSSSASSYPSSWTPAASDTIQSEYSVKRFPPPPSAAGNNNSSSADLFGGQANNLLADPSVNLRFATASRQQQQQLLRTPTTNSSTSAGRPMPQLSSHYHQPADLISNSSTLQLHPAAGNFRHQKISSTLNRNQNRQLPPIPYSTMSVKEVDGPNKQQWRLQQQSQPATDGYRHSCQQQQQQSLLRPNKQHPHKQMASSQTPLIYGVIE